MCKSEPPNMNSLCKSPTSMRYLGSDKSRADSRKERGRLVRGLQERLSNNGKGGGSLCLECVVPVVGGGGAQRPGPHSRCGFVNPSLARDKKVPAAGAPFFFFFFHR